MAHQTMNVNDVMDHAKFNPFHLKIVVAWCLLVILF